jgi:hypothetical protein
MHESETPLSPQSLDIKSLGSKAKSVSHQEEQPHRLTSDITIVSQEKRDSVKQMKTQIIKPLESGVNIF